MTAKWQEIGDLLGVYPDTIDVLSHSSFSNEVKMSKVLQSWLDNEPTPVTWGNIIGVIEGPLQKKQLAIEIREYLSGIYIYIYMYVCIYIYVIKLLLL